MEEERESAVDKGVGEGDSGALLEMDELCAAEDDDEDAVVVVVVKMV